MSTRRLNKDAMGFFSLYKSHLYKDGCLYCQIYITYLQVIVRYGKCLHFANTVLPRTKQPCVSSTVKRNGPQLFFKNNYNRSSNSNINHNNTG